MEILKLGVKILIGIIATEHLYFLWLEMFAWTSKGPKIFKKVPEQFFHASKSLAANQGLYNGTFRIKIGSSPFFQVHQQRSFFI